MLDHTNTASTTYHAALQSLAHFAELLTVVQIELVELHNERETLLQGYADNRRTAAEALFNKMDSNTIYEVGNNKYSIDPNLVPKEKQIELAEIKQDVYNKLSNPQTTEELINGLPINHHARLQYGQKGQVNRAFFQVEIGKELAIIHMIKFILVESRQVENNIELKNTRNVTKEASAIGGQLFKSMLSFQEAGIAMDNALYQNNLNTIFMLQQQALIQTRISNILDVMSGFSAHNHNRMNAIDILAEINNFNREMGTHTASMRNQIG